MKDILSSRILASVIALSALAAALSPTRASAQADDGPPAHGQRLCKLGAGFERSIQVDRSGPWTG